jgi:hypothetical protein
MTALAGPSMLHPTPRRLSRGSLGSSRIAPIVEQTFSDPFHKGDRTHCDAFGYKYSCKPSEVLKAQLDYMD